jgi:hypothetical protein
MSLTPHLRRNHSEIARRLGRIAAAVGLLLQIALAGFHSPILPDAGTGSGKLVPIADEHALCLARDGGATETPADHPAKPAVHDFASCCYWHGSPAVVPASVAALQPIVFTRTGIVDRPNRSLAARLQTGAGGARAPPLRG